MNEPGHYRERLSNDEVWRVIPGWDGYYEVSNLGQVKSLPRTIRAAQHLRKVKGQLLRPTPDTFGYPTVTLRRDGLIEKRRVHRLVLETFVGLRPAGMAACHNDGNPGNNRLDNLRWDTASANVRDIVLHGRNENAQKSHCPLGHHLAGDNLARNRGTNRPRFRQCRACANARSRLHRSGPYTQEQFAATAHAYYETLTRAAEVAS